MIPAWLTWKLVERIGPYVLIAAACLGAYLWVADMKADLNSARAQVSQLKTDLNNEQAARKADVAGLTSLSQGLVAARSAKSADQKALSETIDAKAPAPASPALSAFLACLRAADAGGKACASSGTGAAAPASAGSASQR